MKYQLIIVLSSLGLAGCAAMLLWAAGVIGRR